MMQLYVTHAVIIYYTDNTMERSGNVTRKASLVIG